MIQLRLLGDVSLESDDGAKPSRLLAEPVRFAALAFIACDGGQTGCRARLERLLWPDSDPANAHNALRQTLHRIRTHLGTDALISNAIDLRLNPERVRVDIDAFTAAMDKARFADALEIYSGDLLGGFVSLDRKEFDDWLEGRRLRLRRAALAAAESMAARAESVNCHAQAAKWWSRAVALSPYDEGNLRRWMMALAREGSPGKALAAYRAAAERLHEDFEAVPSRETLQLADLIRSGCYPDRAGHDLSIPSAPASRHPQVRAPMPPGPPAGASPLGADAQPQDHL